MCPFVVLGMSNANSSSATTKPIYAPAMTAMTYMAAMQKKCEAWLMKQNIDLLIEGSSPVHKALCFGWFVLPHQEQQSYRECQYLS